jgi:MarR family transcriptional regulator, lower aerobic nicotinate degradation pathway regulator
MSSDPATLRPVPESDSSAERPPFPPALMERVGFLLAMARGGAEAICMSALAPIDLHVKQFGLLTVLATEGPRSQQELAAWTRMDRTSMVALVDSLEERDLVRRERNPDDRRAYLLQLTPEGRRTQARALKLMHGAEQQLLGALSERERAELVKLLTKVAVEVGRAPADIPVRR